MKLPRITIADIRALKPCYDPGRYIPETWQGDAIDILKLEGPSPEDKLWVVLRKRFIDERTLRLFAVWCAREALKLVPTPDPRCVAACDVAERFANGQATWNELSDAESAAWPVLYEARGVVAVLAAKAAASAAEWKVICPRGLESCAWFSSSISLRAVWHAAGSKASPGEFTAREAVWQAACSAQVNALIQMLQQ